MNTMLLRNRKIVLIGLVFHFDDTIAFVVAAVRTNSMADRHVLTVATTHEVQRGKSMMRTSHIAFAFGGSFLRIGHFLIPS